MIDYATLCSAIDDWKAGRQPSAVTPAAPQRITSQAHDEEEAVEYSAVYDTNQAPAVPDSTVVYAMSEYEDGEGDVDAESDPEADVEADVETDVDTDVETDVDTDVDTDDADDGR